MNESNINAEEKSIKKDTQDDYRVRLYSKRKIKIYNKKKEKIIENRNIGLRAEIEENEENGQILYNEQIAVGKQMSKIFLVMRKILHILVIALTQAGKTGAMVAFIYEYTKRNIIHPDNIYILTGLSSKEWKEQTKFRMPDAIKKRVYHRGDFNKFKEDVKDKQNVLIILDEIQIAARENQQLDQTWKELGFDDTQVLFKKDIKITEFSATPDGCYYDIEEWKDNSFIIKMEPGEGYTSCFNLLDKGRVVQYKDLACLKQNEDGEIEVDVTEVNKNINEIKKYIDRYITPKYHIIRTPHGKNQDVAIKNIRHIFGNKHYKYEYYDQENKNKDINELLKYPPEYHTFIFIKEKCRCAKTLIKTNLGLLYERYTINPNDSVIIQSLLGRLTGYDDKGDSIVFTNIDSIKKYKALWDSGFKDKTIRWNSNTTKLTKRKVIESKGTAFENKNIADNKSYNYDDENGFINNYRIYDKEYVLKEVCKILGYGYKSAKVEHDGFIHTSLNCPKSIFSLEEAVNKVKSAYGTNNGKKTYRTYLPCYVDTKDENTLRYVVVIRPDTDKNKLDECDKKYKSLRLCEINV